MAEKLSGAQYRKQKKISAEQARRNEEKRQEEDGKAPLRKRLKEPTLGDPLSAIAYMTDVALCMVHEILNDEQITAEQRWKLLADYTAKIGMTNSKALTQKRLKTLQSKIDPEEAEDDGLDENPLLSRDGSEGDGGKD